jgi:CheY-like chemotaxis protein
MIYLIDDKKLRQEKDFGWSNEKFADYYEYLMPIYSLEELERKAEEIFKDNNTVLYHESFLDNSVLNKQSSFKRSKLEQFAQNHQSFNLVIFSGSKNSRILNSNIAHLPVSVVYQNLSLFIERQADYKVNLAYLVFGCNPRIESELIEKLENALAIIEKEPVIIDNQSCFFIATFDRDIRNPIEGARSVTLFDEESDADISEFIKKNLYEESFDNIFIPLCYGTSLSDFNGLRLATHIRCTQSPNQLSRIFIYGFVGIEYLINNEYFNILRVKNVALINFSKRAFQESVSTSVDSITAKELPEQIAKLKLDIPKNYEDNHSISNDWAIFRWTKCLGVEVNEELQTICDKISSNLYFKYLRTINPVIQKDIINSQKLQITKSGNPKILFIDDEADKGWNELIAYLLTDLNNIYSDYIGEGFKSLPRNVIIADSIKKIKDDDIDIVILDFRLNFDDFSQDNPDNITGVQLLKEIKNLNPGIQVIVFSATNKVWNLRALQESGADGFVLKESPYNTNIEFTAESIHSFITLVNKSINRGFLKQLYIKFSDILKQLNKCDFEDGTNFATFLNELKLQLMLIEKSTSRINLEDSSTLDIVFINCYNFLEKFKHHYLSEINYQPILGSKELEMNRYLFLNGKVINEGKFIRNNKNDNPSWFHCLACLFIDYFSISIIDSEDILNLNKIKDIRNNYIHGDKNMFDRNELTMVVELCVKITSRMKE